MIINKSLINIQTKTLANSAYSKMDINDPSVTFIPKEVEIIGTNAFSDNKRIDISPDNSVRVIFNRSFSNSGIHSFPFPNVEIIGDRAFKLNKFQYNVHIPDSCTYIGKEAFSFCDLSDNTISIDAKNIDCDHFCAGTFMNSNIYKVYLNDIPCIPYGMFKNCELQCIIIKSDRCKRIYDEAFRNCDFKHINIPSGIEFISNGAFAGCRNLNLIHIPKTVKRIEKNAFHGIDPNAKVYIENGCKLSSLECFNDFKFGNVYFL